MWATQPLKDVCEIRPAKKQAKELLSDDNRISFVPMNALGKGVKYFTPAEERTLGSVYKGYTYFADDDVLLAKITPCFENGKLGIATGLTNKTGFGSSEFIVLRSSERILPEYLYYFLSRNIFREVGAKIMTGAVGHKRVPLEYVENTSIPLPPLEEQKRIVGILDEAFAGIDQAIANTEKNLQNARDLFESYLNNIFTQKGEGWEEIKLLDVCQRLHQGLNTAGQKIKFFETGYPIIQTRNIDSGNIDLTDKIKFMSEEDWTTYKDKYRPEIGDVFFTNIGTIGKTAIVKEDQDYLIHWNIFKIRPVFEKITPSFLKLILDYLTQSDYFKKLQKGGTVDFVTKKMISEVVLFLPPLDTQEIVSNQIELLNNEINELENVYVQKLYDLKELKQSLLQKAFAGELTADMQEAA